ncbi:MAG TPA: ABC transporter permease [Bryobacteraceae bacterium]|jgi:putative ABC transport system permease protein
MSRSVCASAIRNWHRLVLVWRRGQLYRDLAEELEVHRSLKEREYELAGFPPENIVELAEREMGNITLAKEESRDMWRFLSLERLAQDVRYAVRMFARTPVFTSVAVLSLALGIGGNAAMFSLVNTLLIRPLPYFEPGRLVRIGGVYPRAALLFFQQHARTMDVAAVSPGSEFNLTGQGEAIRVVGSYASANFFSVLSAPVARGRSFEPGDDTPGRDGVVILSDALWKTKFGSDPSIVGRAILLNGVHREVVGIMPPSFSFLSSRVQAWVPMRLDPSNFLEYWASEFVPLVGRLRAGASTGQAQGEVQRLVAQFRGTFPYPMARDWNADAGAIPLQQDLMGDIRGRLIILLSAVCMVLLVACANIASLLLSRATTRRKEIALRAALGAGRARIARQLLTESVLLALVGGGSGILLGMVALSIFKSLLPPSTPGLAHASIDWQVVGAVAGLALLTGLGFGIAPALSASQTSLTEAIKTGSQRSTATIWNRFRTWLIAGEIALTVILVVSAGLLIKSLYSLSTAKTGFNPGRILTIRISPNQSACAQRAACVAVYDRIVERARSLSGVVDAAVINSIPLDGELPMLAVDVEDHPKDAAHPSPMFWFGAISPAYLRVMHIPLLRGRAFSRSDGEKAARVLMISESTGRHFWPGQNPIGKHIKSADERQWRTVVGVVGDVRQYSLSKALPAWVPGAVYMPYAQSARQDGQIPAAMTLLVKTAVDSAHLEKEILKLARDQNPNVPVGPVRQLDQIVSGSISDFRSTIRVFITFAGAALLLAAIGIYGLMSYWVTQRTYEIGVRVAIGASRQRVVSAVLAQGLRVSLWGIAGGVLAALAVTRFLASLLYGIGATDPFTFAVVTAFVLGVAVAATTFPAWRAARIDPAKSLRVD